ncbi:MAG: hypothetical protein J5I59_02225 [Saprospiraceae bacterium]|nr:hypothetical protein [Saprospiraceae bacterium]
MIAAFGERLESIDKKLRILSQKYEIIRKENAMLMEENIQLKQTAGKHKTELEIVGKSLSETNKDLSQINANAHSNEDVKKKIDQYIKEIETCIELLENL